MSVVFNYPTTSPTHTVTLPNPQLGNSLAQDIKTIFKRTMDGTMHSFIKTPIGKIQNLSFIGLNLAQYTDLKNLILASAGSQVRYTDHLVANWDGYIVTDPISLTAIGPLSDGASSDACVESYNVTIEFEGEYV